MKGFRLNLAITPLFLSLLSTQLQASNCKSAFADLGFVSSLRQDRWSNISVQVSLESQQAISEIKSQDKLRYKEWIKRFQAEERELDLKELAGISGFPATSWAQVYGREHPRDIVLLESLKAQHSTLREEFDDLKTKAKQSQGDERDRLWERANKIAVAMQMAREAMDVIQDDFVPFPGASAERISQFVQDPPHRSEQEIQIRLYHAEAEAAEILREIRERLSRSENISLERGRKLDALNRVIEFYQNLKTKLRAQTAMANP